MKWFSLLLAFSAGAVLPLQAGINSQLRTYAGSPLIAAFISFLVGTVLLFAMTLLLRLPWPSLSALAQAPWWAWLGGLLGAILVFLAIVLAEQLGAAVMVALIITGQMIVSLLLDHYGLVGYTRNTLSPARIIGTLLLLSGVFLIRYK
jgi:bacterial/archaeal transporter family-2 protein